MSACWYEMWRNNACWMLDGFYLRSNKCNWNNILKYRKLKKLRLKVKTPKKITCTFAIFCGTWYNVLLLHHDDKGNENSWTVLSNHHFFDNSIWNRPCYFLEIGLKVRCIDDYQNLIGWNWYWKQSRIPHLDQHPDRLLLQ